MSRERLVEGLALSPAQAAVKEVPTEHCHALHLFLSPYFIPPHHSPLITHVPLLPQVTEGLSSLRVKYSRSQTADNKATVKGLIDSIESAAKAKTASYTRSSSTPAMVPSLSPIAENPAKGVFSHSPSCR